jgi:hypothetical protein
VKAKPGGARTREHRASERRPTACRSVFTGRYIAKSCLPTTFSVAESGFMNNAG